MENEKKERKNPLIVVDERVKKELDNRKKYPRETYNDVLRRLLKLEEIELEESDVN
jgi:hypothetical protein